MEGSGFFLLELVKSVIPNSHISKLKNRNGHGIYDSAIERVVRSESPTLDTFEFDNLSATNQKI